MFLFFLAGEKVVLGGAHALLWFQQDFLDASGVQVGSTRHVLGLRGQCIQRRMDSQGRNQPFPFYQRNAVSVTRGSP